jgi:transposase-like protein
MAKGYTAAPRIPRELAPRYRAITEVLAGELTVSEAARRLGISRNRFQSVLHRALAALIEGMAVKPAGRPREPSSQRTLSQQVAKLQRDNERLSKRAQTADRILGLASGMLKGRLGRRARSREKGGTAEEE